MRFAWYAGVSVTLAASVILSAFQQRANFYSAMVYLAQSNFCLLVLINFIYLVYGTGIFGLQRLLYGPLRQVEVEQLSEKAWFAITETCLAMTMFRQQIGAWFLVMFTALITGKVWGWIGDGRVEILEQQPPANPGLFHTRLSVSLLLSLAYDLWILKYSITTVIQQARPDMMVMFLFEFAVLSTSSARTGVRYLLSVLEHRIIKQQTKQRLEERRREVRQAREELLSQRENDSDQGTVDPQAQIPNEADVDEMDIEVPGWEDKGQWILVLDLVADCTKLSIYIVFFFILFSFFALPIHIMRDLFMTGRAVVKRGTALWKYRKAVEDMNKYADATEADISREDTCIICREQMRPWDPAQAPGTLQRVRPKKLPCGHILHMGCLKSWLERQQVCPTCRRSVVLTNQDGAVNRNGGVVRPGRDEAAIPPQPGGQAHPPQQPGRAQQARQNGGARVFNFGNLRVGFAQGGENIQELAQRMAQPQQPVVPQPAPQAVSPAPGSRTSQDLSGDLEALRSQIVDVERTIQRHFQNLQYDHQQLQVCSLLFAELNRLQQQRQQFDQGLHMSSSHAIPHTPAPPQPPVPLLHPLSNIPPLTGLRPQAPTVTRHGLTASSNAIPAGSPELPDGVVIPAGWSLLPLQRLDGAFAHASHPHAESSSQTASANATAANIAFQDGPTSGRVAGPSNQGSLRDMPFQQVPSAHPASDQRHRDNFDTATQTVYTEQPGSTGTPSQPATQSTESLDEPQANEILAPNPVLPNWSGENQLFGGSDALTRENGPDCPPQERGDKDRPVTEVSSSSIHSSQNTDSDEKGKGKARAATVEDADQEDT